METVRDFAALSAAITACLRPGVDTNCTLKAEALRREIAAGTLLAHRWPGGLLLLRRRPGRYILSYYRTDPAAALDVPLPGPAVVEIPLRPGAQADAAWWEAQGFVPLLRRVRLVRPPLPEAPELPPSEAVSVAPEAALALLERCFDPLSGCLPTREELAEDLAGGRLLWAEEGALLRFSPGPPAELRHLAAAEEVRGRGLARKLVDRFNRLTAGRRALVWTGEDNAAALHLYESAGFRRDGWRSLVLRTKDEILEKEMLSHG